MNINSVLITGANRGIGLEFVKQFISLAKSPVHVFAVCRSPDNAKELVGISKSNERVHVLELDMKDYGAFPTVVKQVNDIVGENGLNLLINNAGIALRDSFEQLSSDNMMENFEVNTVSPLMFTKACLPLLKRAAAKVGGSELSCSRSAVICITSKMGSMDDNTSGGCYPYRISKAALNMAVKGLSIDLQPSGILALAIHPGWVLTDMGGKNALINTETSVSGMISSMFRASAKESGLMLNYNGDPISW